MGIKTKIFENLKGGHELVISGISVIDPELYLWKKSMFRKQIEGWLWERRKETILEIEGCLRISSSKLTTQKIN